MTPTQKKALVRYKESPSTRIAIKQLTILGDLGSECNSLLEKLDLFGTTATETLRFKYRSTQKFYDSQESLINIMDNHDSGPFDELTANYPDGPWSVSNRPWHSETVH